MTRGPILSSSGQDVVIRIKAVPGASRDAIAGPIGDRLKVRVAAPPEGGRANKAICAVIAAALGVKPRDVSIDSGAASAEKLVRVRNAGVQDIGERLGPKLTADS